jgi:hypothetical protein
MALSEAIIATYMTIHMARSPGSHSERIASPCPEFPGGSGNPAGVAFRQRKRAFVLSDEPVLLAKGIVMQASRWPVREHRHNILRHIVREREWTTRISVRTSRPGGP